MINEIAHLMIGCRRCVVLTGAGISAESGVPTFRGKEGLWGKFKPEELATMDAFVANPEIVWEWYNWRRTLMSEVKPNAGHFALTELAKWFDSFVLVTQNVDGLHRIAGSKDVLELHGNINRNKCVKCGQPFPDHIEIEPDPYPDLSVVRRENPSRCRLVRRDARSGRYRTGPLKRRLGPTCFCWWGPRRWSSRRRRCRSRPSTAGRRWWRSTPRRRR